MSAEQRKGPGGYSRFGTLIFLLTMVFPLVAVGWKLATESLVAFAIYAALVAVFLLLTFVAVRLAPTLREREPTPILDLNTFDSEKHGVPW